MSLIGNKAPDFKAPAVVNGDITELDSTRLRGKWAVLFFYPLDFTFVCPTEILAFSDAAAQFREIGAEVIGVSVDSVYTHNAWINTPKEQGGLGAIDIPLVARHFYHHAGWAQLLDRELPGQVPVGVVGPETWDPYVAVEVLWNEAP